MRETAVPEDHLMRSKFRVAGHMDYSGEIHIDRTKWRYYQGDVSDIPKRAYGVMMESKDV
jgi:hypothetical protein